MVRRKIVDRENNIRVCRENRVIVKSNGYSFKGKKVSFDHRLKEHQQVIVLSPEKIRSIIADEDDRFEKTFYASDRCQFRLTNQDSLSVQSDLVLNFANAVHPGGGYLTGANAQEEALCRQSTLYASISSREAAEMYIFNRESHSSTDSDYMLLSPCVEVFRDVDCNLLSKPYTTAVITAPAPDLHGRGAGVSETDLCILMTERIRNLLYAAAYYGYRNITLGAWGCGAFGHNPYDMARHFRKVLIGEKMYEFFDSVTFAILDKTKKSNNYIAFEQVFSDVLADSEKPKSRKAGYILTSRPFPVCNHVKDITKNNIGFAQGVFSDGTPFEAELWTDSNGGKTLTVVIPAFYEEKTDKAFGTVQKVSENIVSFRHKVSAQDNSVLCIGMTDDGEEENFEVIQGYSMYLEENGVLRFTDCGRNGSILYATDIAGGRLAVIHTYLGSDDNVIAETDLEFNSYLENYFI